MGSERSPQMDYGLLSATVIYLGYEWDHVAESFLLPFW